MLFGPDRLFRLSVSFFRGDSLFLQECNWDAKFCFGHAGIDIFLRLNRVEALFFFTRYCCVIVEFKVQIIFESFSYNILKIFHFVIIHFDTVLENTCLHSSHLSL